MVNKLLSYLSDFFIFAIIFTLFNDDFTVAHFGGVTMLRLPILLLYIFYFSHIWRTFKTMTDTQDKLFLLFWSLSMILLLLEILFGWDVDFFPSGSVLIGIFTIVLFFERYPLNKILYFLWLSMMISAIICYFNPTIDPYTFRGTGGTEDSNEFSTQLLALLFASIYLFKQNKSKLFLLLSIVFFTYAFFKAGSMSAFLAIGFIGGLSLVRFVILKPMFFLNFKALLLILALLLAATQVDPKRIELVNDMLNRTKNTGSAAMRFHVWVAGLHMIENNPILGVGINAFNNNEIQYEEGHMIGAVLAPHNIYIKIFAESGLFMFALFLVFLLHIIKVNIRTIWLNDEWYILGILFFYLFMGITIGYGYDKHFWLAIVIVMNLNYQLKRNKLLQ
jgi:O-antigen ligase